MEFQTLSNFVTLAKAGNITRAAEQLHVSQPALSRQLKDLEEELGVSLVIRGRRHIQLTDKGQYLLRRAKEIVAMADKTKKDLLAQDIIAGDLYIGAGETVAMKLISQAIKGLQDRYPQTKVHLFTGNSDDLHDAMQSGFLDFIVLVDPANKESYDFVSLSLEDTWGLLMTADSPLARKTGITPEQLDEIRALYPRQTQNMGDIESWLGHAIQPEQVIGSYNLLFNAAMLVQANVGLAVCLDQIIDTTARTGLVFRPFTPTVTAKISFAWKRDRTMSAVATVFLKVLKQVIEDYVSNP